MLGVTRQQVVNLRKSARAPRAKAATMIEEKLRSDLRAAALLAHTDYELLEAYVDGRASAVDREIVDAHVEDRRARPS